MVLGAGLLLAGMAWGIRSSRSLSQHQLESNQQVLLATSAVNKATQMMASRAAREAALGDRMSAIEELVRSTSSRSEGMESAINRMHEAMRLEALGQSISKRSLGRMKEQEIDLPPREMPTIRTNVPPPPPVETKPMWGSRDSEESGLAVPIAPAPRS